MRPGNANDPGAELEPARERDLLSDHVIRFTPGVPSRNYTDMFGNTCRRIVAPAGLIEIHNEFLITDSGLPDDVAPEARQLDVADVCRDFAHLAVTLCRCMNIPARYCTGYLGDIGVPVDPAPMDFSAWFEDYLNGRWYTFDVRHNHPRIGRIAMVRGRDAADVAISTTFGVAQLVKFAVITEEVVSAPAKVFEAA
jgi:hypothetical protein